jgi:hypothetical protein
MRQLLQPPSQLAHLLSAPAQGGFRVLADRRRIVAPSRATQLQDHRRVAEGSHGGARGAVSLVADRGSAFQGQSQGFAVGQARKRLVDQHIPVARIAKLAGEPLQLPDQSGRRALWKEREHGSETARRHPHLVHALGVPPFESAGLVRHEMIGAGLCNVGERPVGGPLRTEGPDPPFYGLRHRAAGSSAS